MRSAPKVEGPRDLPDWRLWLVDQWAPGAAYHRTYAAGHVSLVEIVGDGPGGSPEVGEVMARWEHRAAMQAALWWVSDDMVELMNAAAPSVPDDYVLHLDDAPDIAGCVVFGIDANDPDHRVQVDAIVWGPVALPAAPDRGRPVPVTALGMSAYQRMSLGDLDGRKLQQLTRLGVLDRSDDEEVDVSLDLDLASQIGATFEAEGVEDLDRWDLAAINPDGERGTLHLPRETAGDVVFDLTTKASIRSHADECVWVPLGRSDWVIGEALSTPIVDGLPDSVIDSMVEDRKWLAAMWLLAGQVNISDRVTEGPDRAARRRSQRAKVDPKVTVVKLRRLRETSDHDEGVPGGREWHHRWIVSGHWRNQPCGPGRSLRRPVWIAPYVKGPEGAPLVARPKVKALVR